MTRRARLLPLVLLPLLAAGCGGGDDSAAAPPPASSSTSSDAPATTPSASSTTSSAPPAAASCPPTSETVPDGAATAAVDTTTLPDGGDLTGDAANGPATLWISSDGTSQGRRLGVVTGSGVVSSVPIESAGPVGTTALAANLDGAGPVEVLLDDNRTTWLYAVVDCALQPVLGPDGAQFEFDRGFRGNGTGVGCTPSAADGTRSLLGLELDSAAGTVTGTQIPLDGLTASIGSSSPVQVDQEAATSVTCDALTMAANGLAEPGQG